MSPRARSRTAWIVAAFLALSVIPILGGAVRLAGMSAGPTAENARFVAAPVSAVLHIVGASLFCLLGAFQFVPRLRSRGARFHRISGRILLVGGLIAGTTGVWMTVTYPRVAGDSDLLDVLRFGFGTAMVVFLVLAWVAIRRGDVAAHRVWMIRAYAVFIGAGTQALVHIPFFALGLPPGELGRALLLGGAWVLNLAVAEWVVRRKRRGRRAGVLALG